VIGFFLLVQAALLHTTDVLPLGCRFIHRTLSCHNLLPYRAPPPNSREPKRAADVGKASCILRQCSRHGALPCSPARQVSFSELRGALASRDHSRNREGHSRGNPANEHGLHGTPPRGRSCEMPFHIAKHAERYERKRH
jgi:hypothetical protein